MADAPESSSSSGGPLTKRVTFRDLAAARREWHKLPMLTCYDATSAAALQRAGVPILLVGDSAAMVVFGQETTTGISQRLIDDLAAGVRRGAPLAYLVVDMAFGSYHGPRGRAVARVCRTVRRTGCDAVKLEVGPRSVGLVTDLADAGVAVWVHLGLRPQSVRLHGYRARARTAGEAVNLVDQALEYASAGAAAVLLEAVPPEAARAVVEAVDVPVIGCGAGDAPAAHVVVLPDLLGLTPNLPRFVPRLGPDVSLPVAAREWVRLVTTGAYPAADNLYAMEPGEAGRLADRLRMRLADRPAEDGHEP